MTGRNFVISPQAPKRSSGPQPQPRFRVGHQETVQEPVPAVGPVLAGRRKEGGAAGPEVALPAPRPVAGGQCDVTAERFLRQR